eukprot:3937256-Amphidinium_carterae.1
MSQPSCSALLSLVDTSSLILYSGQWGWRIVDCAVLWLLCGVATAIDHHGQRTGQSQCLDGRVIACGDYTFGGRTTRANSPRYHDSFGQCSPSS